MRVAHVLTASVVLSLLAGGAGPVPAARPFGGALGMSHRWEVELELVGDGPGAASAFQQWLQTLSRAGVKHKVRIRSAQAIDKVGIEDRGTKDSPLYVVTGIVKSADELLLPAGRFRRRDAARLAGWLDDLAKYGPEDRRPAKSAFGLSQEEFERIHKETARPIGFSTKGLARAEAVERIGHRLSPPPKIDPKLADALKNDQVGEELSGLSCGTALAYVLRPMGWCLVPRGLDGGTVWAVVEAQRGLEVWPVGWDREKKLWPKVLPELFELRNVNLDGVSAATALEAIGQRLKVPVLVDHNALARHGIDPAKQIVSHPRSRTNYSQVLRTILFQAGLKYELRVDEADKPFLWISTVKPM